MGLFGSKKELKNIKILDISFLSSLILILFLVQIINISPFLSPMNDMDDHQNLTTFDDKVNGAAEDGILFQGTEEFLNITDYGNLYEVNQKVSLTNEEELNLTHYLDDEHDWKVSEIQNNITNIQDKRDWVNNSDFHPVTIFRKYESYELDGLSNNNDETSPYTHTITEPNSIYMRVHFDYMTFYDDYLYIYNETAEEYFIDSGDRSNFYSPWIPGDTIAIDYRSNNFNNIGYGYYIDYYEFINGSSNYDLNSYVWNFNYLQTGSGKNTYGFGEINDSDGVYLGLYGEYSGDPESFSYEEGDFTEITQNITIPRGAVVDAYISFDYYLQYGIRTNDNTIYFKINGQKIYSKGMMDIDDQGKNAWHHTGKYNMDLWDNTTNIFNPIINDQDINISIGFKCGGGYIYTNFDDGFLNIIWLDNIELVLITKANASQEGINLTINKISLSKGTHWGETNLNIDKGWDSDPITLTLNTSSPLLTFELDTVLYGFHNTSTYSNQQFEKGVTYKIFENGTVHWEFFHNFYMPNEYSDFEFIIYKPVNWRIISVTDQMGYSRPFESGEIGDSILKINKSHIFQGWWKFIAMSPNFLNISNTKTYNQGEYVQTSFKTGESTRIKTQVNYSNEIPPNIESTLVDLTIYHPNGTIWHEESRLPDKFGNVTFSEITIGSHNTTGGVYNYTLLWSNGSALGGLKSSFIVIHNSSMTLYRPLDAVNDLIADGYVGDVIPLRIELLDSENNLPVPDALITYNWTGGQQIDLEESASGIYEAIIYTDTLALGLYKFLINSSKIGFVDCNLTLSLNLGEDTKLQRLEYDYYIEFHSNTTIIFQYLDSSDNGIDDATVKMNISNPSWYTINNTGEGIYGVEINTTFISNVGFFYLNINFTKGKYESQERTYQFEIVEQSVNLTVLLNAQGIEENSLIESKFNEEITIKARSMAMYDRIYLSEGNFTFLCGDYEVNLTKSGEYWFNNSIKILTTHFSLGYNYAYIKFSMDNYQTTVFPFQIIIGQIPIEVLTIDFDDSIDAYIGDDISIEIQLKEVGSNINIDGASVSYSWEYGVGSLDAKGSGIYELDLEIPDDIEEDDYKITLVISKEGSEYKSTEFSFMVDISQEEAEEDPVLLWIILSILIAVIAVLAVLSYRSYVLLPRKRRKKADLLARTQRFKDLQNIQAIVIIHKSGGMPVFLKSYSILEHQKKELFSGFIHAITTIGEEISGNKTVISEEEDLKKEERVLEIDFKHFHCLIADKGNVRSIFILRDKSSERLRKLVKNFSLYLHSKLKDSFNSWDGSLDEFERDIPPILNKHFELFYKEPCKLAKPDIIAQIRKENELNSMELRILNVIYSILKGKGKSEFFLDAILEVVHEENKDLIIDSIESLIGRKIIVPSTNGKYK